MKVRLGFFIGMSALLAILIFMLTSKEPILVDGYLDKVSYSKGRSGFFYFKTDSKGLFRISITDLSGKVLMTKFALVFQEQRKNGNPSSLGFGYTSPVEIDFSKLAPGAYLINSKIPFLIKYPKGEAVDITLLFPSFTLAAYTKSGGQSFYTKQRANKVSINRPVSIANFNQKYKPCLNWFFNAFQNLKVNFIADSDMVDFENIRNSRVIVLGGHSEYWTRKARANFDKFIDDGGNGLILSGNTMWWQVRFDESSGILTCYKGSPDPIEDQLLQTVNWDYEGLKYPIINSIGADFPRGGYGSKDDRGWNGYKIVSIPGFLGKSGLKIGDTLNLVTSEYDGAPLTFDHSNVPKLDLKELNFYRGEVIGFDLGSRVNETIGTWIWFQKHIESGIIINTASSDWCSNVGIGENSESGQKIRQITKDMITFLLSTN